MKISSRKLLRATCGAVLILLGLTIALTVWRYPRTTDPVAARTVSDEDYRRFYEHSYAAAGTEAASADSGITKSYDIRSEAPPSKGREEDRIRAFVREYHLQDKRVLDIGSGQGALQDVVAQYTGLDISSTAARFYHKPFVVGSATELPFPDNSFDAVWTIDVLEHVPQPEKALSEMRRVLRPDGYLFLHAAWDCRPWAAEGYAVRPFRDFTLKGKMIKASIPVRDSLVFRSLYVLPIRLVRLSSALLSRRPTAFRYNELRPNYKHLWTSDSDAVNSMDAFEAILWFTSRGDRCLNHRSLLSEFLIRQNPIVLQIKKTGRIRT
jgi:SAM-dependent methyltransferase